MRLALPGDLLTRFRPLRELGRGGGGTVLLVEDLAEPPSPKALKIVRRTGGAARRALLRREFEVLRRLRHPGLVPVFDFGEDKKSGVIWFTSEHVPGRDLYQASAGWTPSDLYEALAALAETLEFVHGRGVLHNDIKSSNIRVPAGPESARLLDFGIAAPLALGTSAGGTPPYMAPERLEDARAPGSVRGDLYSLGVVFYACATRRVPYQGGSAAQVRKAMEAGTVPPRLLRPDLPNHLEAIILRLMAADPAGRYGGGAELLEAITQAQPGRRSDSTLPTPALLGRDSLLAELRQGWSRACAETGPARWLIVGEAGAGKSRVLSELRQTLELDGARVVSVQAHQGAPRAWDLAAEMYRRLTHMPDAPSVPALRVLAGPPAPGRVGRPTDVGDAFVGFCVACAAAPLAVLVDDLGWGDRESVSALLDAAAHPASQRLLIVAAAREDEATAPLAARCRDGGWRVEPLSALAVDEQRALLDSLFPGSSAPPELADEALAQAGGNPLALEEIVRAWVAAGAARRVDGAWRTVAGVPRPAARAPVELIAGRLGKLPDAERATLLAVALHGRPLARGALEAAVAGALQKLPALVRDQLLVEAEGLVDVRHPSVRQAASSLAGSDAPAIHMRLGRGLEQTGAGAEDLWQHWLRAGETRRGLALAIEAGARAEMLGDFPTGRAILEQALDASRAAPGALGADDATRLVLALAGCQVRTAGAEAAAKLIDESLPASSAAARPLLLAEMAHALCISGEYRRAAEVAREAGEIASDPGIRVRAATWRAWAGQMVGDHARVLTDCLAARPLAETLEKDPATAALATEYFQACGAVAYSVNGPRAASPFLEAAFRAAERTGMPGASWEARNLQAGMLMEAGRLEEALQEFAELDAVLARDRNPTRGLHFQRLQARAVHYRGDSAVALARLTPAIGRLNRSADQITSCMLAEVLSDLADPEALVHANAAAQQFLEGSKAANLETALAAGFRCGLWLGSSDGTSQLDAALGRLDGAPGAPVDRAEVEFARGAQELLRGDPGPAVERFSRACELAAHLMPLVLPRCRYFFAHALALAGRRDDAVRSAGEAAAGYGRLGNEVEHSRALALAARIQAPLPGGSSGAAGWLGRLRDATSRIKGGNPRQALADIVASASGASAVWIVGGPDATQIVARAGPCGAAHPIAWRRPIEQALASKERTIRRGVGAAIPVEIGGESLAVAVEDRTFPQAFGEEAREATEIAVEIAIDRIGREQLRVDLEGARRFVQQGTGPAGGSRGTSSAPTVASRSSRLRPTESRLLDLTLGPVQLRHAFGDIVGRGRQMRHVLEVLDRLVQLDINVLVIGETGTGKELVARALHEQGPRSAGPFVAVNCSALPPALAESEFFGHLPGAFTGAGKLRHRGLFEQASGGTLFLDEVGELEATTQAKLLRALEAGEVRPLGGTGAVEVDVRVVAATNRELRTDSEQGRFRSDLYFRLAVVEVRLPPLRDRAEDIPHLVRHLIALVAPGVKVSQQALDAIAAYPWPGNVRELRNELERAAAFCEGGIIRPANLSANVQASVQTPRPPRPGDGTLREALGALEMRMVEEALRAANGNKAAAARALGLTWNGMQLKLRRLGLAATRRRKRSGFTRIRSQRPAPR